MARESIRHTYTLPSGTTIVIQELGLRQLKLLTLKDDPLDQSIHGLRLSIVQIGDTKVNADTLAGDSIDNYLSLKDIMAATAAFNAVHMISDEETEAVKKSAKTTVGGI